MNSKILIAGVAGLTILSGAVVHADNSQRGDHKNRIEAMFQRYDANSDGKITRAEITNQQKVRFEALDRNKDRRISEQELAASKQNRPPRSVEKLDRDGDRQLDAKEMSAGHGRKMLARFDANNDGVITKAEVLETAGSRGPNARKAQADH